MKTAPKTQLPTPLTRVDLKAAVPMLTGGKSWVALAAAGDAPAADDTAGTTGELWLYGLVGGYWSGFNASGVADALRGMDVDNLIVRIHSPGGSAYDGVAIGNLLRNHKATVTVVVDGIAASAASVIALAGDTVVMCPGSQMMIHDASTSAYGCNAGELRTIADWIDGQSANYAGVYAYRAGGTAAQWREAMLANAGSGTWYTADEAVAAKLADEVGTRVAVGSPPTRDQEDEDDEETWARIAHDVALLEQYVHPAARAAWLGEQPPSPRPRPRTGSTETEGGSAVALSPEQITMRQKLGIAEDADEATTLAALTEALDERADADADTDAVPPGHVVIPAAEYSDLQTGAKAGTEAAAKLHNQEREAFLDANRTKFAKENRAGWAEEYDRAPEGTRKHFETKAEIIPASDFIGHATDEADAEAGSGDVVATVRDSDAYKNWSM